MTGAQVIALVLGPGGVLVLLLFLGWLWLRGKLPSPSEFQRALADAESWKRLYFSERDAHQVSRDALAVANERAEIAVENAKVTTQVLQQVQARAPGGRPARPRKAIP